jgi:hypothetical protein
MILRPLHPAAPANDRWLPAWQVVERLQRQKYESCWMITQPSHAVLAGGLAARLQAPQLPRLDADLLRAIALHDAGWGIPDAQAITRSRAPKPQPPRSFLETEIEEFLDAWTQSIQVAQSAGAAGAYIVSRHFQRLAEHRMGAWADTDRDRKKLETFVAHESQRQKRLAAKQERSAEELESLTDVLQFCDLLSLYICSGARENTEFPECLGLKLRLSTENEAYRLDPPLFGPGAKFSVASLRYPETKEVSSTAIEVTLC